MARGARVARVASIRQEWCLMAGEPPPIGQEWCLRCRDPMAFAAALGRKGALWLGCGLGLACDKAGMVPYGWRAAPDKAGMVP
ncbi:hypothetical protein J2S03_002477 [Alicyclobacillus cycloheptanicus]|uniref:Uncharacterized protein n=1 Tax=Alicyclobacillus cycloheptanicus TaxID=1457 RepID=A0ABT9XKE2_9BACL|nr:hypothetical protein [Alicyclobacillus cycloheptanicus]